MSPAGVGLGCELTSVGLQTADISTISWPKLATVVLRAAAATGDIILYMKVSSILVISVESNIQRKVVSENTSSQNMKDSNILVISVANNFHSRVI